MHTKLLQACLTLCNPKDCSPPGSSVQGVLQARIREWVAMPFSRGSSWSRDRIPAPALQVDSLPMSHWGSPESIMPAFKVFSNTPVINQKKVPCMSDTCLNRTTQPYCSSQEVLRLMDGFKNSSSLRNLLVGSRRKVSHWLTQKNIYCSFKWKVTLSRNLRDSLFRTQMISAVFFASLPAVGPATSGSSYLYTQSRARAKVKSSNRSLGWVFVVEIGQVSGSDWLSLGKESRVEVTQTQSFWARRGGRMASGQNCGGGAWTQWHKTNPWPLVGLHPLLPVS